MHQLTKKDNPQHVMRFLPLLGAAVLLFLLLVQAGPGRAALSDLEKKELYAQGTEYFHQV